MDVCPSPPLCGVWLNSPHMDSAAPVHNLSITRRWATDRRRGNPKSDLPHKRLIEGRTQNMVYVQDREGKPLMPTERLDCCEEDLESKASAFDVNKKKSQQKETVR